VPTFMGVYDLDGTTVSPRDGATDIYGQGPPRYIPHLWEEYYSTYVDGKYQFDNYYDPLSLTFDGGTTFYQVAASYDGEQQLSSVSYDFENQKSGDSIQVY
jgi:hypothetical protein